MKSRLKSIYYSIAVFTRRLTLKFRSEPDFIIIGSQKGGTSSIFYYLSQHPNIKTALRKQIHFFDLNYSKGLNWYKAFFPITKKGIITGEATPYYLVHPRVPKRISQNFPNVKLIVLLRHPIKRAYSHYQMIKQKGRETELSFNDALAVEDSRISSEYEKLCRNEEFDSYNYKTYSYLNRSLYHKHLLNWAKYFPKNKILLVNSDDFFESPNLILEKIYQFLEIPISFPDDLKVINKGKYHQNKIHIDSTYLSLIRDDSAELSNSFDFHPMWTFDEYEK